MRTFYFLQFLFFFVFLNHAQDDYFQQKVNTYIEVSLNDEKHELSGFEKIDYTNNSPQSLDSIVIHLWPNAYKNNSTEMAKHDLENGELEFRFSESKNKGYIDSLNFSSNEKPLRWSYLNNKIDIAVVYLHQSLQPSETITISTPFKVKIPLGIFSRLGHIGQSYQITQWFPKPAVYDKNGWHPLSYLSQGEFYSEFGTYDVKITLPENYVVGATGDLIDGENERAFLLKKVDQTKKIITSQNYSTDMSFPESSSNTKTLHFHQENVHDFAWFADKRYHVLKGEVELPHSKRKVNTWAMFTNNEFELWEKAIEHINDATYNYSLWVGDYPYNHVTAVDGSISAGGGMEYPNITVIGESGNSYFHDEVITHEVGHNWFYGILGSNERDNAWMDEGINSFVEYRHMNKKYGDNNNLFGNSLLRTLNLGGSSLMQLGYKFNASRNNDQPIQMGSSKYTSMNYGIIVYGKTGLGFNYLKEYLGDSIFDFCMRSYFEKWKFKHPQPKDIKNVFEKVSNKNLNWFFDDYIGSTKKIDYKISRIKKVSEDNYSLKLKNKTGFNAPISISGVGIDSSSCFFKWIDGFKADTTIELTFNNSIEKLVLNKNDYSSDLISTNNHIKTKGILKKVAPLKFKLLAGLENSDYSTIYYVPVIGWNSYNRLMAGVSLYNSILLERNFEWNFMPMYSFDSKDIVGSAGFNFQSYPTKLFSRISFGANVKSYYNQPVLSEERWIKSELFSEFRFKSKSLRSSPVQKIKLRAIRTDENSISPNFESIVQNSYFGVLDYQIKNKQFLTPKSLTLRYIYGANSSSSLVSSLSLTANYRVNYNKRLNGVELRFFAGYNFYSSSSRYNFLMKGQDGYNDYLYERTYLGRNVSYPNMLIQQSSNTHGAFNVNTSIGRPEKWILASNIKIEIPKIPFGIFSDVGVFPNIETYLDPSIGTWEESKTIEPMLNAGLYFSIKANKKEVLSVYLPLLHTQNINNSSIHTGNTIIKNVNFLQKITFVLSLENVNPRNLINSFGP